MLQKNKIMILFLFIFFLIIFIFNYKKKENFGDREYQGPSMGSSMQVKRNIDGQQQNMWNEQLTYADLKSSDLARFLHKKMVRITSYGMNIGKVMSRQHRTKCFWENKSNFYKLDYRKHDGYFWIFHLGDNEISLIDARPLIPTKYRYCSDNGIDGILCNRYDIDKTSKFKLYNLNCSRDNANEISYNPEIGNCTTEDNIEFAHELRKPFYIRRDLKVPLKKEDSIRYDPAKWTSSAYTVWNRLTRNKGRQQFYIALRGGKNNKLCYLNKNGKIDHFTDGTKLTCTYENDINLNGKDVCSLSSNFKNVKQPVQDPYSMEHTIYNTPIFGEKWDREAFSQNQFSNNQSFNNNSICENFETGPNDINTCLFSNNNRKKNPYILRLEIFDEYIWNDDIMTLPEKTPKEGRNDDKPNCCFNTNGLKRNIEGC